MILADEQTPLATALAAATSAQRASVNRIVPINRLGDQRKVADLAPWVQQQLASILQTSVRDLFPDTNNPLGRFDHG